MPVHPLALKFPEMPSEELVLLVESIRKNGLQQPIRTYDGQIVDGRHREEACHRAKVPPRFDPWFPTTKDVEAELWEMMLTWNARRRHLTASQRAMLAAEANQAAPKKATIAKVAEAAKVSRSTVERAQRVLTKAPEKVEQVKAGKVSLNRAETKPAVAEKPRPSKVKLETRAQIVDEFAFQRKQLGEFVRPLSRALAAAKVLEEQLGEHEYVRTLESCYEDVKRLGERVTEWERRALAK